jgi:hypothetical protein
MDHIDEAEAAAFAVTEVANAMQLHQNNQFEQLLEIIKALNSL